MNGSRKSDESMRPRKHPNKPGTPAAEGVEGEDSTKGSSGRQNKHPIQRGGSLQSALARIRQAATRDDVRQLTALWHHVSNIDSLRETFLRLRRDGAPGVDKETWATYASDLDKRLEDLASRLKRGAYRAKPVRRVYIPKPDGRERPLGIPTLEDKLVQSLASSVLGAVYEEDFLGAMVRRAAMASDASAPKPTHHTHLGSNATPDQTLAPSTRDPS